jgi:4-hydroxy-tetrahydrodipicolinate synthase
MKLNGLAGSLVAIVTPMGRDGAVDYAAWSRIVDFHLQNGTNGIVVGGSTGESATISDAEIRELSLRASQQVAGRIPIITGAGTSSTATTVERVRWLSELPIDGLLVVTPAYNRPTQEGLYQHYAALAKASRLPLIAYNVPSRTAVDMLPETVGRISQLPNIIGLKESVAQMERIRELRARCGAEFSILSGDDATARQAVYEGAQGVISVTANVAPRAMADMIAAARAGDRARAEAIDARLAALHDALFLEPNPIPVKWAMAQMGLIGSGIRLPMTEFAEAHRPALSAVLRDVGVIS